MIVHYISDGDVSISADTKGENYPYFTATITTADGCNVSTHDGVSTGCIFAAVLPIGLFSAGTYDILILAKKSPTDIVGLTFNIRAVIAYAC